MSIPQNPQTIVVRNQFYPKGLTEQQIWDYYQSVKHHLLDETKLKDLMFFIAVEENKFIAKRKAGESYIRLTPQNYDNIITGRTVSIHSAMRQYEEFGIIDIDVDPNDGFRWAKKVTLDTYDYIMDKVPVVKKVSIRFTGKTSFHIVCDFERKMKVDTIRHLLETFLRSSPLVRAYTVSGKRTPGVPNLDLHPNKIRGNYISLYSLSILGLRCMDIPYRDLLKFDPRMARI
jgi:hypothetical protein